MTDMLIGAVKAAGFAGFEGWASTTQLDRQGDVVLPEAFAASLDAFKANGPIFWNHAEVHDPLAKPIGRATDAVISEGGLHIKARWASTNEAQEVRSLVMDGIVSTMSIGYNPISSTVKAGINYVDRLELMEVSIVAIPANPGAVITAAKRLASLSPVRLKADDADYEAAIRLALGRVTSDVVMLQAAFAAWMGEEAGETDSGGDDNSNQSEQTPMTMLAARRVLVYKGAKR